jgi:hypothetical protein
VGSLDGFGMMGLLMMNSEPYLLSSRKLDLCGGKCAIGWKKSMEKGSITIQHNIYACTVLCNEHRNF